MRAEEVGIEGRPMITYLHLVYKKLFVERRGHKEEEEDEDE